MKHRFIQTNVQFRSADFRHIWDSFMLPPCQDVFFYRIPDNWRSTQKENFKGNEINGNPKVLDYRQCMRTSLANRTNFWWVCRDARSVVLAENDQLIFISDTTILTDTRFGEQIALISHLDTRTDINGSLYTLQYIGIRTTWMQCWRKYSGIKTKSSKSETCTK